VDAFVHCAYDFAQTDRSGCFRVNVDGSLSLLRAARVAGVHRLLYISSLSSFPGAASIYGQSKFVVEEYARSNGIAVIRPGLIVNAEGLGIFGKIARAAQRTPVLPLPGMGQQPQYLVGVRELAGIIAARASAPEWDAGSALLAAHQTPLTIRQIVRRVGGARFPATVQIPIPISLVRLGLGVVATLGLKVPFREDSLVGLLNQDPLLADAQLWPDPCLEFEDLCRTAAR
jgi:NADH dehydrogenase